MMEEHVRVEPMDRYNEHLVEKVHPPDWCNPEPTGRYNMVVIGAGTAGLVTAAGSAGLGAKVALIERHLFGGDCLNYGCVPSKSIIRSARAVSEIKAAKEFGLHLDGQVDVDFPAVMERMRRIRSRISEHDSVDRFQKIGIGIFLGDAKFAGPDSIEVQGQELQFARACIATGARAVTPGIEGLAEAGFLTNETAFSLTQRPRRLAVLGAGPLGCELAQTFARLGCEVTLIQRRPQLLPREDNDASQILLKALLQDGINILLEAQAQRVEKTDNGKRIHLDVEGQEKVVVVDEILVGAGRAPNVEDLNLEAAGVQYDSHKGVIVDDTLRTTNKRIYAAGDVCLQYKFTHTADAAARIVIQNALFWGRKKLSALTIPWCTYTDPEIAHVGMYEQQASEKGIELDIFTQPLGDVDRAIADSEEKGFVKIHVRKGTGKILGATIVARHAGEMISEITLAMVTGASLGTIASVIHPYPTQVEAIKRVGDSYNRMRLTPFVKKLFAKLMAWKR
jgi:pyruvate/2-oxoglutarate dehydrogenase complex dihydrolipoamide dehydrogenase (E3) component